jgi:hypothetical protein
MENMNEKDKMLWKLAKKRVEFRRHLATYVVMNGFFWALWLFTDHKHEHEGVPWPFFPMLGWGIGLAFHFLGAYGYTGSKLSSVEKEYEKLKNQQ